MVAQVVVPHIAHAGNGRIVHVLEGTVVQPLHRADIAQGAPGGQDIPGHEDVLRPAHLFGVTRHHDAGDIDAPAHIDAVLRDHRAHQGPGGMEGAAQVVHRQIPVDQRVHGANVPGQVVFLPGSADQHVSAGVVVAIIVHVGGAHAVEVAVIALAVLGPHVARHLVVANHGVIGVPRPDAGIVHGSPGASLVDLVPLDHAAVGAAVEDGVAALVLQQVVVDNHVDAGKPAVPVNIAPDQNAHRIGPHQMVPRNAHAVEAA